MSEPLRSDDVAQGMHDRVRVLQTMREIGQTEHSRNSWSCFRAARSTPVLVAIQVVWSCGETVRRCCINTGHACNAFAQAACHLDCTKCMEPIHAMMGTS